MSMILDPYRFGGGASSYLDQLATTPIAVWSINKLISTATVSIRVRRSSDDAEQDIGFSADALDTAALASFVGANSGFVVTFYDQTGNGHHFTQATTSRQARIVNAGAFDDGLVFDGSNDGYTSDSVTFGGQHAWVFSEFVQASDTNVKALLELSADYSAAADRFIVYDFSTQGGLVAAMGAAGATRGNAFSNAGTLALWAFKFDRSTVGTGEVAAWRNGSTMTETPISGSVTDQTGNFGSHVLNLGARNGGTAFPSTASIRQAAVYAADVSAIRTSIEGIMS